MLFERVAAAAAQACTLAAVIIEEACRVVGVMWFCGCVAAEAYVLGVVSEVVVCVVGGVGWGVCLCVLCCSFCASFLTGQEKDMAMCGP